MNRIKQYSNPILSNSLTIIALTGMLFSGAVLELHGQTLIGSSGNSAAIPSGSVSWSVGESVIGAGTLPGGIITQGYQQPGIVKVRLWLGAILEGPYVQASGLMNDALRSNGLLPLSEPYTALGYVFVGGGGEATTAPVLSVTGNDAIVDWVVLELRDEADPAIVVETRSGLVQRDGDVVAVDGASPLSFLSAPGSYYIAVHHRNHLGAMTRDPIALGGGTTFIDLTDGSIDTHGTDAQAAIGNVRMLWCGDVNGDAQLKYTGQDNDRDPILVEIGGSVPTSITTGYKSEDVNMDGVVKYVGEGNDRDPILQNIGGNVPTAIRNAQLP